MKKFLSLISAIVLTISALSSCSVFEADVEKLMKSPQHSADNEKIISTLNSYTQQEYELVYPVAGEKLSPIVLYNSANNAAVFYKESDSRLRFATLSYKTEWQCVADTEIELDQIEKIDICDFANGENIIVSGSKADNSAKRLVVLSCSQELSVVKQFDFEYYITDDFNDDGQNELAVISGSDQQDKIDFYEIGNKVKLIDTVEIASAQTRRVKSGKLFDNQKALFVDSFYDESTVTEVIYGKNGEMIKLYSPDGDDIARNTDTECVDIDGDGYIEIPFSFVMPGYEAAEPQQRMYLTSYKGYDGAKYQDKITGDFNYTDNYYIKYPEKWIDSVSVEYDEDNALRSYVIYDAENEHFSSTLIKVKVYTAQEYERLEENLSGVIVLERTDTEVYAARIVNKLNKYAVDEEQLKNMFGLLN